MHFLVQLQLNWKTVLNVTNFWIWMEGLAWRLRTKGQDFHHSRVSGNSTGQGFRYFQSGHHHEPNDKRQKMRCKT